MDVIDMVGLAQLGKVALKESIAGGASLLSRLFTKTAAENTAPKIPFRLMDDIPQWANEVKAMQEAGQAINLAKKADVKYIDYLQKKFRFGDDSREILHELITKQNLSKKEIEELARELKNGK